MAAALKSGWIKQAWQRASASAPELLCKPRAKRRPQQGAVCCAPRQQPRERRPSQRGWGPGPALIQARKCHRLSTAVKWKSFGKVEEAKTKGWKNKHLRSAGALWLMSVPRKGPNAWETNQQLWSTNIWLAGTHCYSQIFLSHQAAQSSLSTAPAAAWAVNLERPQTTLGEING